MSCGLPRPHYPLSPSPSCTAGWMPLQVKMRTIGTATEEEVVPRDRCDRGRPDRDRDDRARAHEGVPRLLRALERMEEEAARAWATKASSESLASQPLAVLAAQTGAVGNPDQRAMRARRGASRRTSRASLSLTDWLIAAGGNTPAPS